MSRDCRSDKQFKVAYVILVFCVLSITIATCVNGFAQNLPDDSASASSLNREKRQQFPFPLEQFFQFNSAEFGSATQLGVENDFENVQDDNSNVVAQQQSLQRQFPQVLSNLIEAAAVQQPPTPQQLVRTVMNSGLK